MHPIRKQRLLMILIILFGITVAATLALYALRQNINLYFSPTQVMEEKVPIGQIFRVGGFVEKGSIHHGKGLEVNFMLTDTMHHLRVEYNGILPDLFREGQYVITQGKLDSNHGFIADQVLAKHDAKYVPKRS